MRYLKLDKGWKCLETGQFFEFGDIVLDYYRFYDALYGRNCTSETYDKNVKVLEEQFGKEQTDNIIYAIEYFREIVQSFVWDKDYAAPVNDFKVNEDIKEHISIKEQINLHQDRVALVRNQGWYDFPEEKDISEITFYLLKCANTNEHNPFLPFNVYPHFIDNKWYFAYEIKGNELLFLDLIEMQKQNYELRFCKFCDNPFIKKRKNQKCCSDLCKSNNKKELDKNRMATSSGYKKKVYNYMYSSKKFTRDEINSFLTEFEEQKTTLSEEQTLEWLMNKHEEFKMK